MERHDGGAASSEAVATLNGPCLLPEAGRPRVGVVICCYSEDRWDDLSRSIASVRSQSVAPIEMVVVVDHNPALLAHLRAERPD
ncbi:MAG: glycosyltransferase family 2 protein, partial [Actinomycetota bacterium]